MKANRKGSGFERKVAKLVATTLGVTPKEIYRTPLSGGHPYGDPGDLVISPEIIGRFPFTVECKHHKTWFPGNYFKPTAKEKRWIHQVQTAAGKMNRPPLLVVSGNKTGIYCIVRADWLEKACQAADCQAVACIANGEQCQLRFTCLQSRWVQLPFSAFLGVLGLLCPNTASAKRSAATR